MWFYEELYDDIRLGLKGKAVARKKTPYQRCSLYDTPTFGRILVLDGIIQTTEKDEFIYHEMLTHPVMLAHPSPKKILIIGGGDGGVLREALKYNPQEVVMVEIDKEVVELCRKFLPAINRNVFRDKRVRLVIDNGAEFIKRTKEKFDIVIVDSSDPIGPSRVLFSKKFYEKILNILDQSGLMIRQTGSSALEREVFKENYKLLKKIFPCVKPQIAAVPTYIGGFFSFIIGSKKIDPHKIPYKRLEKKYKEIKLKTKYYNPDIHFASGKLPNFLKEVANEK